MRDQLWQYVTAAKLAKLPDAVPIRYCGIVTLRQSLPTAKGVIFISQVIVRASVRDEYRDVIRKARCLGVKGRWQRKRQFLQPHCRRADVCRQCSATCQLRAGTSDSWRPFTTAGSPVFSYEVFTVVS